MSPMRNVMMVSLVLAVASGLLAAPAQEAQESGGWRTFAGSWSSTGQVQTLPTEGERPAAIIRLSGSVVLTGELGLSRGFRGEAIGFDAGGDMSSARAVWTDEHGDQIFSEIKGEPVQTGRHVVGTIKGGTGRYAGVSGQYEFTWQYVIHAEDGTIQGRTEGLKGQIRGAEGSR